MKGASAKAPAQRYQMWTPAVLLLWPLDGR